MQLRQRIITMFFKSLTSRSADVVQIAKEGLKRVIQQQSLSKVGCCNPVLNQRRFPRLKLTHDKLLSSFAFKFNMRQCSSELLQSSLRPILVNLAHYKNLTMPLLVGLERLLELLSNWFNPTLGEKLLEHLRRWLEPDNKAVTASGQAAQAQARAPPKVRGGVVGCCMLTPG